MYTEILIKINCVRKITTRTYYRTGILWKKHMTANLIRIMFRGQRFFLTHAVHVRCVAVFSKRVLETDPYGGMWVILLIRYVVFASRPRGRRRPGWSAANARPPAAAAAPSPNAPRSLHSPVATYQSSQSKHCTQWQRLVRPHLATHLRVSSTCVQ